MTDGADSRSSRAVAGVISRRHMPPRRGPIPRRPSRAQGHALAQFEEAYFAEPGHTQETLVQDVDRVRADHQALAPKIRRAFSASTYHSWRRQKTSPSVHDLEVLSRVAQQRLTIAVDPGASTATGEDGMSELLDDFDRIMGKLARLTPRKALLLLGGLERDVDRELAVNPSESDAHPGGAVRRNR